jgi:putative transposase
MSKAGRLLLENVYFHVMARGNQKQATFLQDSDFNKYLALLKHYKRKYHFKLFAWCLMPNHVHLILSVNKATDLRKIMQGMTIAYVRWFNKKYGKVGHLWQGRYKSMVIQKEAYVLNCINYIEMNPVRANLTQNPMDYAWSSLRARVLGDEILILDNPEV